MEVGTTYAHPPLCKDGLPLENQERHTAVIDMTREIALHLPLQDLQLVYFLEEHGETEGLADAWAVDWVQQGVELFITMILYYTWASVGVMRELSMEYMYRVPLLALLPIHPDIAQVVVAAAGTSLVT